MEFDKPTARKSFNRLALIFILYNVVFGVVYNIVSSGVAAYLFGTNPNIEISEVYDFLYNTGFALIGAATISVLAAFLCSRQKPSFEKNRNINIKTIIMFFVIIQGLQLVCSFLLVPLEGLFSQAGYSFDEAVSLASDPSIYFSSLIYSVVVAPVMEELFFRGLVLRKMEPYGKMFAIIISAMLFSLMHQNIVQMPVTFAMGMLFGYIAIEYSLGAAIVLHLLNNAFVEVSGQLGKMFDYFWAFDSLFMYACTAASVLIFFLNLSKIKEYLRREKPEGNVVKCFFTRPLILIVIAYYLVMTFLSVSAA